MSNLAISLVLNLLTNRLFLFVCGMAVGAFLVRCLCAVTSHG